MNILDSRTKPFPYFLADHCLADNVQQATLDWFEGGAPWKLASTDFYEQYEFSLLDAEHPESVAHLVSRAGLDTMREVVESTLNCSLTERIELVAHKLVTGQRIGIHNDFLVGQETHRLTIQLNRGLTDDDGGFFMLFDSFDATDVHRVTRPLSNSGIGFEIGPSSHHAVSRVHGGSRYTLVYSFHAQSRS